MEISAFTIFAHCHCDLNAFFRFMFQKSFLFSFFLFSSKWKKRIFPFSNFKYSSKRIKFVSCFQHLKCQPVKNEKIIFPNRENTLGNATAFYCTSIDFNKKKVFGCTMYSVCNVLCAMKYFFNGKKEQSTYAIFVCA